MEVIHAGCDAALITDKVYVIIMMMARFAVFLAKRILDGIVCGGNGMNDALLHEGLQGAVDRYAVVASFRTGLHIMMRERRSSLDEYVKDTPPAFRDAELVSAQ